MEFDEDQYEDYEGEVEYGEDAEYEHDENAYNKAFEETEEVKDLKVEEADSENKDVEYEYDEVVGARDKKPVMSKLNQRVLGKYEMDDLLNEI